MKLKEILKNERENFPDYYLKYNRAVVLPFVIAFIFGPLIVLAVSIPIGIKYGEHILTFVPFIAWSAVLALFTALYVVIGKRVKKRLIADRAAELEDRFKDIPLNEAAEILRQTHVINDSGFICEDKEVFSETAVPFGEARFAFGFYVEYTKIVLNIAVGRNGSDEVSAVFALDGALYNFLIKKGFDLSGNYVFDLLINDKKKFAELLLNRKIKYFYEAFGNNEV